jgi:Predicted metal binding domain
LSVVDPTVSRAKFDREIRAFRRLAADYRKRGWFLADASFPRVLVVLAAPQLKPPAVVAGVLLDYTDYDLRPPSVRLVDPFTAEPYLAKDLPVQLFRQVAAEGVRVEIVGLPGGAQPPNLLARQPLMQSYGPEEIPFLCLAGVREYHDHPGHSGDVWELHRASGAGRLVRLLDIIDRYGIRPLSGFNVALEPKIVGFVQNEIPS